MKVLIISNNPFSSINNMGKTLCTFFNQFEQQDVYQLYIQQEKPNVSNICSNYYQVTDVDVLKSCFCFKCNNHIYDNIQHNTISNGKRKMESLYQIGRNGNALMSCCRDLVWKFGHWFNKNLKTWLHSINPDIIFFTASSSKFMYDLTYKISNFLNIPIIVSIFDDYFINNSFQGFLSSYYHRTLENKFKKILNKTLFCTVNCSEMKRDYTARYNFEFRTFYTGTTLSNEKNSYVKNKISYLGNISIGRGAQLVKLGKALLSSNNDKNIKYIDVYTSETNEELLKELTLDNGIKLHPPVTSDRVDEIIRDSLLSIHTESFDVNNLNRVMYSISTKIPNILSKGNGVLAFGPSNVASISYLKNNDAAYIIDNEEYIIPKINEIINNDDLRRTIAIKGKIVANKNHNIEQNSKLLKSWINNSLNGGDYNENITN